MEIDWGGNENGLNEITCLCILFCSLFDMNRVLFAYQFAQSSSFSCWCCLGVSFKLLYDFGHKRLLWNIPSPHFGQWLFADSSKHLPWCVGRMHFLHHLRFSNNCSFSDNGAFISCSHLFTGWLPLHRKQDMPWPSICLALIAWPLLLWTSLSDCSLSLTIDKAVLVFVLATSFHADFFALFPPIGHKNFASSFKKLRNACQSGT